MYLLGTQELLDLISRDTERPIFRWLADAGPGENDLFVSVISLGIIAEEIEAVPPAERGNWRRLLARGRRSLTEHGSVIPVDLDVVDAWAAHLRGATIEENSGVEMGEDERLVIATAIARGYSLVTCQTSALEHLIEATTLTVIDPDG